MRRLKLVHLLPVVLLALPVGAQQTTRTDFREYLSPDTHEIPGAIGDPLTSGGFDFYNATEFSGVTTGNAFGTWGTADPGSVNRPVNLAPGANTIFATTLSGTAANGAVLGSEIDILLAGTNPAFGPYPSFGLASIDFAHLYSDQYFGNLFTLTPISLDIWGRNSRGEQFFQNFIIPVAPVGQNGFRTPVLYTANLDARFSDVNNVWFNQGTGSGRAFQFTNVTPTPEPASLALLATGLVGVIGLARRRRVRALAG